MRAGREPLPTAVRTVCRSASALAAAACVGGTAYPLVSPAEWLDAAEVVGVEGVPSSGSAPHPVVVRAVNRFGASVPPPAGAEREVLVDGAPVALGFDGFGYATVDLEGVGAATVSGLDGDLASIEVHTLTPGWPAPPLQRAWPAPFEAPALAAAGTSGGIAAFGNELWWVGDGAAPHRILEAEFELVGVRSANIDVDGVTDAVAWDQSHVYLLRGRSTGGMAWGGALAAPGRRIAGADVGDLSGDNLPDLAIAWVDEAGEGLLDVLEGDGLFAFRPAAPRTIPGSPLALVVADNTGEGVPQVTVLHAEGDWSRFAYGAPAADGSGRYMPIGPRAPVRTMKLPPESVLLPTGDTNGDGGAEVTVAGPRYDGQGRDMWFVDVKTDPAACAAGDPDAQCGIQFLNLQQEPGAYVVVTDANGDYRADVLLQNDERPEEQGALIGVTYDPLAVDDKYGKIRLMELPAYGPMAAADMDRDGSGDVFLAAGAAWWRWLGRGFADLERLWEPAPTPTVVVREQVAGPIALLELDGNEATIEVVGASAEGGPTRMRLFRYDVGGGRATLVDEVELPGTGPIEDLAVCGSDVYVVAGGTAARLVVSADAVAVAASVAAGASRIACGDGPTGAEVATLEADGVQLRTRNTLGTVGGPVAAPGAADVAIGIVGGGPAIGTCATDGCSAVYWPIGGAGAFALGDAEGILVDDGAHQRAIGGAGRLSVADLEADGRLDLVGLEPSTGLVSVFRSDGDGVPHPDLYHTELELTVPFAVADGDGDGIPDLWSIDAVGDVIYFPSAPPAETAP